MRIGFRVVLYILLLNLTCGLLYVAAVPGTLQSQILVGTGDPQEYSERFNASEFMNQTSPGLSSILTYAGHIWSALTVAWNAMRFTVLGFPTMLQQIAGNIADASARATFLNISYVLEAVFGFVIFMWLFELVTGRSVED